MSQTFFFFRPTDNVADNATWTVQTGTEDSSYPATNVPDLTPKLLPSPGKVAETSGAWVADFGAAQRVDLAVLLHNFDAGSTVRIQGNASNAWGAPTFNQLFTIPAVRADGYHRKVFLDLRSLSGYTTTGFRYWRIVITSTNSAAVGIKALLFSTVRQLNRDFRWGVQDVEHQIGITMKTDAGVRWGYDLNSAPRTLQGEAILSDSDAEVVREWFRSCAGVVTPFVIIPEPTGNDAWLVFWSANGFNIESPGSVISGLSTTRQYTDANTVTLGFEEAAIGDPEWV
ncbi:MAG TPA: hypothetical protein VF443_05435, partial [Nitrospira sp.]